MAHEVADARAGAPVPVLLGRGAFVPDDVLTNADVARVVDPARLRAFLVENVWCARLREQWLSGGEGPGPLPPDGGTGAAREAAEVAFEHRLYDAFVADRVGVRERRVLDREALLSGRPSASGRLSSDLGAQAGGRALADANLAADDVDLLICGSSSPDRIYPGTALRMQSLLGARHAFAFDVSAACSSFVVALATARAHVAAGLARRALVVSAEAFTYGVDWADPASACFFGDGAGAVVVGRADDPAARAAGGRPELLDVALWSEHSDNIRTGLGGTAALLASQRLNGHAAVPAPGAEDYPYFFQDGPAVYRDLVPVVVDLTRELLARHGLPPEGVRSYLLHQASAVMIDAVERRLLGGARPGVRLPRNLERYGNTSSAGVAIALAEEPPLESGETSCLLTFGGGYAVAAALLRQP